jgi:hypothetical protein
LAAAKEEKIEDTLEQEIKDQEEILKAVKPKVEAVISELAALILTKQRTLEALRVKKKELEENPPARAVKLRAQLQASLKNQDSVNMNMVKILKPLLEQAEEPMLRKVAEVEGEINAVGRYIEDKMREKERMALDLSIDEKDLRQAQDALARALGPVPKQRHIKTEVVLNALIRLSDQLDYWDLLNDESRSPDKVALAATVERNLNYFNLEMIRALILAEEKAIRKTGNTITDDDFLKRITNRLGRITKAPVGAIDEHLRGLNIDISHEREELKVSANGTGSAIAEQQKEPFIINQNGKALKVVISNKDNFMAIGQLFEKDGSLKKRIAKSLSGIFSDAEAAKVKRKNGGPLDGIYDLRLGTSQGRYALYIKFYKDENTLAIVAYATEEDVHADAEGGMDRNLYTHLKNFVETDTYDKNQFNPVYVNKAMSSPENTGGIDLTPNNMNLETTHEGGGNSLGIHFHLDAALFAQLQNSPGFVPVIINIQPVTDLKMFLGLTN